MKTEILSTLTAASDTVASNVVAVYGMGSFFRSQNSKDVDLVLVLRNDTADPGATHAKLHGLFRQLGTRMGVIFDPTLLLECEFAQRLLLEQESLTEIMRYRDDWNSAEKTVETNRRGTSALHDYVAPSAPDVRTPSGPDRVVD